MELPILCNIMFKKFMMRLHFTSILYLAWIPAWIKISFGFGRMPFEMTATIILLPSYVSPIEK